MLGPRREGEPELFEAPKSVPEVLDYSDFNQLVRKLREVSALDFKGYHPYSQSNISLVDIPVSELNPCALYLLNSHLKIQTDLRNAFLRRGLDTLNLPRENSIIRYNWGTKKDNIIFPPIVEVSQDDGGLLLVVDGLHRVILARNLGILTLTAVLIENVSIPLPVLPVGWDKIERLETVPAALQKRRFRFKTLEEAYDWSIRNLKRFKEGFTEEPTYYSFFRVLDTLVPDRIKPKLEFGKTPTLEAILAYGRDLTNHDELYNLLWYLNLENVKQDPIHERLVPLGEESVRDLKREWGIEPSRQLYRFDMRANAFQSNPDFWELWNSDPDFTQISLLNVQPAIPVHGWELVFMKYGVRNLDENEGNHYAYLLGWLKDKEILRLVLEADMIFYSVDHRFLGRYNKDNFEEWLAQLKGERRRIDMEYAIRGTGWSLPEKKLGPF